MKPVNECMGGDENLNDQFNDSMFKRSMWAILRWNEEPKKQNDLQVCLVVLADLPYKLSKRTLSDQKVRALLILPYLPERHCSWTIPMLSRTLSSCRC